MSKLRAQRVGEEIKKEINQIIRDEIKDPRIGFITITRVEVSPDLRYARVFVSIYGNNDEKKNTLAGLDKARGFIRSEIGKRIRLRYVPEISFKFDESIEQGARILELLEEARGAEKNGAEEG